MPGLIEIQSHNIDQLISKVGIIRDLERFDSMWLETIVRLDSLNG